MFKACSEAHDVLANPEKRKIYDEFGEEGLKAGFDPEQARQYRDWQRYGGFGRGTGGQGFYGDFSFDEGGSVRYSGFEDLFENLFGGGESRSAGGGFGGGPFTSRGPRQGRNVESSLEVDFVTAIRGGTTRVTLQKGAGDGVSPRVETIDVNVPAGVDDGSRIRLSGKGEPGAAGGPAGDLFVTIRVKPHPLFRREGDNLRMDVPVTVAEAMKGAEISVPTINGSVQLRVPPGTKSGQVLRLKGKGVPNLKTKVPGDLFVTLRVQVPSSSDAEAIQAAETLDKYYSGDLRAGLRI
jgi:DnaJ-class molecular chaperone